MSTDEWEKDLNDVKAADEKIRWGDKESKAYFRGHTEGENSTIYDTTYKGLNKKSQQVFN